MKKSVCKIAVAIFVILASVSFIYIFPSFMRARVATFLFAVFCLYMAGTISALGED